MCVGGEPVWLQVATQAHSHSTQEGEEGRPHPSTQPKGRCRVTAALATFYKELNESRWKRNSAGRAAFYRTRTASRRGKADTKKEG